MKQRLIAHLPQLAIADVLGSTEGGMGNSIVRAGASADQLTSSITRRSVGDARSKIPGSLASTVVK